MNRCRLINHAHVLWQSPDSGQWPPEPAIAMHVDDNLTLVLEQEERSITLNLSSIPEVIAMLKDIANRVPGVARA